MATTTSPMMRQIGCLRTTTQPSSLLGRRSISTIYTPKPDPVALPSKLPKLFNSQLPTRLRPDQGMPAYPVPEKFTHKHTNTN